MLVSLKAKPTYLTERANGDSDYAKEKVVANRSGWVFTPGNPNSGNDNKGAQPEVLVCSRNLQKSIDVPTPTHITLGNTTDKTAFFPDGDTFTGVIIITWRCDCIHLLQRTNPCDWHTTTAT